MEIVTKRGESLSGKSEEEYTRCCAKCNLWAVEADTALGAISYWQS